MSACWNNKEKLKSLHIHYASRAIFIYRQQVTIERDVLVKWNLKQSVKRTAEYRQSFEEVQLVIVNVQRAIVSSNDDAIRLLETAWLPKQTCHYATICVISRINCFRHSPAEQAIAADGRDRFIILHDDCSVVRAIQYKMTRGMCHIDWFASNAEGWRTGWRQCELVWRSLEWHPPSAALESGS